MADIADVEQAMVSLLEQTLYPNGIGQASAVAALCRVYRGWPNSATLNADLRASVVNVTVAADNESGRTTTRYLPEWYTADQTPGVSGVVAAQTVTISGNPLSGDVIGVLVDHLGFSYRIQEGDTPSLIAANLALMIQADYFVKLDGTTITMPAALSVVVRAVCDRPSSFESRRQEKDVRVACWCADPAVRDSVAAVIDNQLSGSGFLELADGTAARVVYKNTASYDQAQNALLYRRDLIYTIEYGTVTVTQQPSMLFGASRLDSNTLYG